MRQTPRSVRFGRIRRKPENSPIVETGRILEWPLSTCTLATTHLSLSSKLGVWEVRCPASRLFHEPNSGELSKFSAKLNRNSNIQIPIDAKYVTRGIAHRGDLEQGPNGDLWSILFQLIDERSGVTDFIKVQVAPGRFWPVSHQTKQGSFPPHARKFSGRRGWQRKQQGRLLPDLNLERKAKMG